MEKCLQLLCLCQQATFDERLAVLVGDDGNGACGRR